MTNPDSRRGFLRSATACAGLAISACAQDLRGQAARQKDKEPIDYRGNSSGLMVGFPPPPEKRVTLNNYTSSIDKTRWAFQNPDVVFHTVDIDRGQGPVRPFDRQMMDKNDLNAIHVPWKDAKKSFSEWLAISQTDALVIVRDGRIVSETYVGDMRPESRHICFSAGKSFLAATTATFLRDGELSEAAQVETIVPELAKTGLSGATIRHLLDQTSGIAFKEFASPTDEAALQEELTFPTNRYKGSTLAMPKYSRISGILPLLDGERKDYGLYDFLFDQKEKTRRHGEALWYCEPHVLALQLILDLKQAKVCECFGGFSGRSIFGATRSREYFRRSVAAWL